MFKFKLSNRLIEKFCLILHVFRENGVPGDVFWYMLKPLFKTNIYNVYTWENDKFVSVFEYEYNFNVAIRNEYDMFNHTRMLTYNYFKLCKNDYQSFYTYGNTAFLISRKVIDDIPLYTIFKFCERNINVYVCFNEIDNNDSIMKSIDENYIKNIIKKNAHYLHDQYIKYTDMGLKYWFGMDRTDLERLLSYQ
jgi:hypothetical protein